jgi:AraC family transcriptional regulator
MMPARLPSGIHHGILRSSRPVGDLTLVETIYGPGLKTRKHTHERSCFAILLDGNYMETISKGALNCSAGDVIFTPSDTIHSNEICLQGARSLIVEVGDGLISNIRRYSGKQLTLNKAKHGEVGILGKRIYNEWRHPDDLSSINIEALTIELCCWFSRLPCDARKPDWLKRVHERLLSDFREKLTLCDLAMEAGVHPAHLARSFRYHFRCTIGDFIRRTRVQYAAIRIECSDDPLSRIALDCGFSNQAHFSRIFHEIFGTTPGKYRATFRNCKKH